MGSPATSRGSRRSEKATGHGAGDSFRPAATVSAGAAAVTHRRRRREGSVLAGFELAAEGCRRRRRRAAGARESSPGGADSDTTRPRAWRGLHRREDERARRGEQVARLRREPHRLLRLSARLVPPDDDPGWTHSALYVAPSETARRRRYRLRMSYGEVGHRGVADGAADGVEVKALKLEDEKPRLPLTGKDFGQPGEEDDARETHRPPMKPPMKPPTPPSPLPPQSAASGTTT